MTRWWAYATLAIALVCGSVAFPETPVHTTREAELVQAALAPSSVLRKRNGKHKLITRRDTSGSSPFTIIPATAELASPTVTIVEALALDTSVEPPCTLTSARAPPRS